MNKFEYTKHVGEREELPNGLFRWVDKGIKKTTYLWKFKDGFLIVNGKKMKVEYEHKYTYSLRKTKIKSYDLENVLNRFTQDKFWKDDAAKVFDWVIKFGKEVQ